MPHLPTDVSMGVLSHLGERSWITRRSRESKASCQDAVSSICLLKFDFGCKVACDRVFLLSYLSSACYEAPGEVFDQDLVVAWACACYTSRALLNAHVTGLSGKRCPA